MSGATAPEAQTIIRNTQTINATLRESSTAIDRLQGSLDRAWRAQQRFEKAQATINRAVELGRRSQEEGNRLLQLAQQRYQQTGQAAQQFAVANDNAARSMGRSSQVITSAGFQLQDFATQVAGGTSALTAFAQQAPQFLGVFGSGGAIAGAVVAVAAVAAGLLLARSATDQFRDAMQAAGDTYARNTELATRWREGLETEQNRIRDLTSAYEAMNVAGREFERRRLEEQRGTLRAQGTALDRQTDRELQDLRRVIDRQIIEARDATLRARRFDRNAPAVQVDAGIRDGVEALTALGAPGERTADQVAEVARRLSEASLSAGPFAELLRDTAGALDALIPNWRTLSEAVTRNERDLAANAEAAARAGQSLGGMGDSAAGAAGRVDGLTASVARLQERTNALVGIENAEAIARAERRAEALARGLGAAREFDAAEAQRQSAERFFQEQRRQDEERLRSERYNNDQIREEIARTDEARRQSANRRAELEAQNAARLRALEEAERAATRGARGASAIDRREQRETERLITSLDAEAGAALRLKNALDQLAEARTRGMSAADAERLSALARQRYEEDLQRARARQMEEGNKTALYAEETKRLAELNRELSDIVGGAFSDMVREGKSFEDTLKNIERQLLRLGDKYLLQPLLDQLAQLATAQLGGGGKGGMGGGLGSLLMSLAGSGGAEITTGGGLLKGVEAVAMAVPVAHTGGLIDDPSLPQRVTPAQVFMGAPRFHSGGMVGGMRFASDEVPAILRRGEMVLTERQQKAVAAKGDINQTIIVQTSDPGAFNRTRSQVAREMRRDLARAARSA